MNKIANLFKLAIALAQIAEEAVPLPGKGKEKMAFVATAAKAIFGVEENVKASWGNPEMFAAAVGAAAEVAVALLNAAGVFKKAKVE